MNGPYNYVGDGNVEKWIETLEAARKLGARIVCPGHGPRDAETMLANQQKYFRTLRERVGGLVNAMKTPEQVRDSVGQISAEIKTDASIARYVGPYLSAQAEKVYNEMTGNNFPAAQKSALDARHLHAHAHGHSLHQHV